MLEIGDLADIVTLNTTRFFLYYGTFWMVTSHINVIKHEPKTISRLRKKILKLNANGNEKLKCLRCAFSNT